MRSTSSGGRTAVSSLARRPSLPEAVRYPAKVSDGSGQGERSGQVRTGDRIWGGTWSQVKPRVFCLYY